MVYGVVGLKPNVQGCGFKMALVRSDKGTSYKDVVHADVVISQISSLGQVFIVINEIKTLGKDDGKVLLNLVSSLLKGCGLREDKILGNAIIRAGLESRSSIGLGFVQDVF